MIQILYTQDHKVRALALQSLIPVSFSSLVSAVPITKNNLDTLLFWGHGDAWKLCGLTPTEMVKLIKDWKKQNSKLNTVEFITCNTRHCTGNMDPFIIQVKAGLKSGFHSSTRNIALKGLPVNVGGSRNAFSILLAEPATKSWCYVTGPGTDDTIMQDGAKLIQYHDVGGRSVSFRGDIAQRANQMVLQHKQRKWTMNYGYFNTLRSSLVVV